MDAVQGWFESLWDNIYGWLRDAVSAITNFMTNSIKVVQGWISAVQVWISSAVGDISTFVVDAVAGVATWITDAATSTVNFLHDHMMAVGTWIREGVEWTVTSLLSGLEGISSLLSSVAGDIGGAVAGFGTWIAEAVQGSLGWLSGTIWGWFDGALSWASDTFRWLHGEIVGAVSGIAGSVKTMFDGAVSSIGGALTGIFEGFIGAFGAFNLGDLMAQTTGIMDQINATYIAGLAAHSPLTPEEAYNMTHSWMWTQRDHWYQTYIMTLLIEGASLGQVDGMVHMVLKEPQLAASLKLAEEWFAAPYTYGYGPRLEQYWYSKFTPLIPPVVDLIQFVVREVITPERFYAIMPYVGFGAEWSAAYWEAHFVLPAPVVLYDAFHRGKITSKELNKYIFWHDYKTEPRPDISISDIDIMRSVLKTLIPRVDLRYAWEMGSLSDEELVERYRTLGYEDDAELMAKIQMGRALVEEVHKVRDEWIRDFLDGFSSENALRANLAIINIGPARIDYYVTYAKKRRGREALRDWLDIYRDSHFKDLIDDEALDARAREILVDPVALELYLTKAYIRKYKRPPPPKEEAVRAATLAYIARAFREDLLTEEAFRAELKRRAFSPDSIETIMAVEVAKKRESLEVVVPPKKSDAEFRLLMIDFHRELIIDLITAYEEAGVDVSEARERYTVAETNRSEAWSHYDAEHYREALEFGRDAEGLYKQARSRLLSAKEMVA